MASAAPQRPQIDWPTWIVSDEVGVTGVAPAEGSVVSDISITHTQTDNKDKVTDVHTNITDCKEKASVGDIALITKTLVNNDKALEEKINNISVSDTDTDTKTAIEIKQITNADGIITVAVKQTETTKNGKTGETIGEPVVSKFGISGIAGTDYVDNAVNAEATERVEQDTTLQANIDAEAQAREAEDARIEQKFDKEVSRLDSKIDKLDGRIEKVGAMSAAIANLHTMGYDPAAPTEIAVGVGQYRDKTGLAVGAFHYPNRDFMMSFSVSTAGDEFMAGIGATWKIGRKSPEQMLKAQQEKAAREKLAEAEAMKQAAKDARVAAQQARHAKMLAERSK